MALRAGLVELVKASITGSILGNLLLILGLSLVAGGSTGRSCGFNRTAAGDERGDAGARGHRAGVSRPVPRAPRRKASSPSLRMSEAVAVILIMTYLCSLLFYAQDPQAAFLPESRTQWRARSWSLWLCGYRAGHGHGGCRGGIGDPGPCDTAHRPRSTASSPQTFLGLIIIPIIGNAAEHATAVMVARKGQIDLALQIALGSSTQVALLVAPLLVFVGLSGSVPARGST